MYDPVILLQNADLWAPMKHEISELSDNPHFKKDLEPWSQIVNWLISTKCKNEANTRDAKRQEWKFKNKS